MSSSFIGSKIAIVTKSQNRYVGTIIGIDADSSLIILGNVKCYGVENRPGGLSNGQLPGGIVPIMQFANSDIEDLKIVSDEQTEENSSKKQQQQLGGSMPLVQSPPAPSVTKQASIHDDPAIVSAVVSSANKDSSMSSRLIQDLHHLNLSDDNVKSLSKKEESHLRTNSGELGEWSSLLPTKWPSQNSSSQINQQSTGNKSKFFDDFMLNSSEPISSNRSQQQQRWPSNTHSTQTSYRQQQHQQQQYEDDSGLPVRQPFFSDDQPYPSQSNRSQNGYQQRSFHQNRRPPQRRPMGGNRETFYDNGNLYESEFDFETSNRRFNKITSEDELKQHSDISNQNLHPSMDNESSPDFKPLYDKKKSFFDNITAQETSDLPVPMYHRSRNQDTFGNNGNDRSHRQKNRGGYRRSNNQNYRQQQGNEDFHYRQQHNNNNQNGYHYRY